MVRKSSVFYFLIVTISLSSCKAKLDSKIYDKWMMCHLVIDGEELLENNLKQNGFDVPYIDTTKFFILESPQVLIIHFDRHNQVSADFDIISKEKIKVTSCERSEFIGEYDVILTERDVNFPEIKTIEYDLLLKSKRCSFYLRRNIPHPSIMPIK